jgi:RHH-type proline utilization regulon transcriptional repressor/proline dehydrogenase/delta 1-pyrroline-5-carboxylate dehydrogenase
VDDPLAAAPDVALFGHDLERAHELRRRLAESDGPIVPLVGADAAGRYDASRLVTERTVTINTTASGGNASLLSLTEAAE